MATSGKKGKKNKGTVLSLQSFLANGDTPPGITKVAKKVRTRGDESDDEDALPQIFNLPTAPRASRIFDDDTIPQKPPFLAYITNLPFDVKEDDMYEFFQDIQVASIRLPKEEESGRLRGFGYVEFATRDDLIHAIRLPDPHIRNRRIRIDVSNENEQQQNQQRRGAGNRSRYDGFGGNSENRESTNWRRGNDNTNRDDDRRGGGGYGYNRERQRDGSIESGGNWRSGDRPKLDASPARRRYNERSNSGRRGGSDEFKRDDTPQERPKLNLKPRTLPLPVLVVQQNENENDNENDVDKEEEEVEKDQEKSPSPEPAQFKPTAVAAEKIFGAAKPVDTAAREQKIEERLERERFEKLNLEEEEEETSKEEKTDDPEKEIAQTFIEKTDKENTNISWRRKDNYKDDENKSSPDQRAPHRRNDDRRPTRDNRDRRDFNRGGYDRDNRNRDRDRDRDRDRVDRDRNRDRDRDREYSNRDRDYQNRERGTSRDDKNHPKDNRPGDDKPKRERQEKPMPKYQPHQSGPVLSSSNKYSVFLDAENSE